MVKLSFEKSNFIKYVNEKATNGVRKTWHIAMNVSHILALIGFLLE
tara:strand:+ start:739 stop:876 length:138 start_codon:yes stop_codon:yes gene_type:complete